MDVLESLLTWFHSSYVLLGRTLALQLVQIFSNADSSNPNIQNIQNIQNIANVVAVFQGLRMNTRGLFHLLTSHLDLRIMLMSVFSKMQFFVQWLTADCVHQKTKHWYSQIEKK